MSEDQRAPPDHRGPEQDARKIGSYEAFHDGEETFYHPFTAPTRMENSVIEFDLNNLQNVLTEKTNIPVQKIAENIKQHYMDSSRLVKRAFGNKVEDDFQLYNWGLTLALDLGLNTDKLELLLMLFSKKMPRRITLPDFEKFIKEHSTWRKIKSRSEKKRRWFDLISSFKIHTVKKEGYPDSIGKRQFQTILEVTEVDMDLDIMKVVREMRKIDKYTNRVHMLLMDDPLISGNFSAEVADEMAEADLNPEENERLRDFEARIKAEEEEYGEDVQREVDARLQQLYEEQERKEEARREKIRKREEERAAIKKAAEDERIARLARLEEVRQETIAIEKRKDEEKRKKEEEERLAKAKAEHEEIMRKEEEYARFEQEGKDGMDATLEEEFQATKHIGKFDHLTGAERVRAEAAERLAEHRRLKKMERMRLLEETRRYAESTLAQRTARDLNSRLAGYGISMRGDDVPDTIGDVSSLTTPNTAGRKRKKKTEGDIASGKSTAADSSSGPLDPLEKLKRSGSKRGSRSQKDALEESKDESMDIDVSGREADDETSERARKMAAKREAAALDEIMKQEKNKERLRKIEEERIRQIELAEKIRQDKTLQKIRRKQLEEEERLKKLEEVHATKREREKRKAESESLRQAEEARLAQLVDEQGVAKLEKARRKEGIQKDKEEATRKAKAMREAKRELAMERAKKMREDEATKRDQLAHALKKKKPVKKKGTSKATDVAATAATAATLDTVVDHGVTDLTAAVGDDLKSEATASDIMDVDARELAEKFGTDAADDGGCIIGLEQLDQILAGTTANEIRDETGDNVAGGMQVEDGADGVVDEDIVDESISDSREAPAASLYTADAPTIDEKLEEFEKIDSEASMGSPVCSVKDDDEIAKEEERLRLIALIEAGNKVREEQRSMETDEAAAKETTSDDKYLFSETGSMAAESTDVLSNGADGDASVGMIIEKDADLEARKVKEREDKMIEAQRIETSLRQAEGDKQKLQETEESMQSADAERSAREKETIKEEERQRLIALMEAERLKKEEERYVDEVIVSLEDHFHTEVIRQAAEQIEIELVEAEKVKQQEEKMLLWEERDRLEQEAKAKEEEEMAAIEEEARLAAQKRLEDKKLAEEKASKEAEDARITEEARLEKEAEEQARDAEVMEKARLAQEAQEAEERAAKEEEEAFWNEAEEGGMKTSEDGSRPSSRQPSIPSLPAFEVHEHDKFTRPQFAMDIEDIRKMPAESVSLVLPKSDDGTLRVNIREDYDGEHRGLFFHGFKKDSAAALVSETLEEHDEVLTINGMDVEGKEIGALVEAIQKGSDDNNVSMAVRRHHRNIGDIVYEGIIPDRSIIHDHEVMSPEHLIDMGLPNLSTLHDAPAEVLEVDIPKSFDGSLGLELRRAVEDGHYTHALVVYAFPPDSKAAKQGLIKRGDEVLALNGFDLREGTNEDVSEILALPVSLQNPNVKVRIRRHHEGLASMDTPKDKLLENVPAYSVMDGLAFRHPEMPSLDELAQLPVEILDVTIPKSEDGTLRINIRHDDEGDIHGLFVHGFKPNCVAEKAGLVRVGDELIELDHKDVEGQFLSALISILQGHEDNKVHMKIRRHNLPASVTGATGTSTVVVEPLNLAQKFEDAASTAASSRMSTARTSVNATPRPQIKSARSTMTPRVVTAPPTPQLTARSDHEVFQIHDTVTKHEQEPSLSELILFPAIDINLEVPYSKDGTLRMYIRHDDEGDAHGLFVHGFKNNSAAEAQGLIKVGDELLILNDINIKGLFLEDVVNALQSRESESVTMTIRRHIMSEDDELLEDMVAHEFESNKQALMQSLQENDVEGDSEDEEEEARRAERKKKIDKIMQEQKRQRLARMEREAEERAKAARAMPNSLLTEKAKAVAEASKPYTDFDVSIPKTQGELRLHVKYSYKRGLFVHSFKPDSLAEKQGLVQPGDELLKVEGHNVHGKSLKILVEIIKDHKKGAVNVRLRRHKFNLFEPSKSMGPGELQLRAPSRGSTNSRGGMRRAVQSDKS